jgi:hypothetical protein
MPFIGVEACLAKGMKQHHNFMHFAREESRLYTYYKTLVYETIKSFGEGEHYTACDGIPRFKMTESPISWSTKLVTVEQTLTAWDMKPKPPNKLFPISEWEKRYPIDCGDGVDTWQRIYDPKNATEQKMCSDAWNEYVTLNYPDDQHPDSQSRDTALMREEFCGEACEFYFKDELVLLYWPSEWKDIDICAPDGAGTAVSVESSITTPRVVTVDAITFKGKDLYWSSLSMTMAPNLYLNASRDANEISAQITHLSSSILSGPFYLTYPTIYIAHHNIYVTDGSRDSRLLRVTMPMLKPKTEKIKDAGLIALHSSDLSSIGIERPLADRAGPLEFAKLVAAGQYPGTLAARKTTALFNLAHLVEPVPASVYFAARTDCWGKPLQKHCSIITEGHHRPRLHLPAHIMASAFGSDYSRCTVPALMDPPMALRPILSSSTLRPLSVTRSGHLETMAAQVASPGSGVESPWPETTTAPKKIDQTLSSKPKSDSMSVASGFKVDIQLLFYIGVLFSWTHILQ